MAARSKNHDWLALIVEPGIAGVVTRVMKNATFPALPAMNACGWSTIAPAAPLRLPLGASEFAGTSPKSAPVQIAPPVATKSTASVARE